METEVLKNGPGAKAGKLGLGFAIEGGEGVIQGGG